MANKKRKKNSDMLIATQNSYQSCEALFETAIGVVQNTIQTLDSINGQIESKVQEIDAYQRGLSDTREQLVNSKDRNAKILANFQKLLEVD